MIVIWGHLWPNPHLPSKFQPLLTIYTVVMGVTIPQRVYTPKLSENLGTITCLRMPWKILTTDFLEIFTDHSTCRPGCFMKIWNHFGYFYESYEGFKYFTFAHAQTKVTVRFWWFWYGVIWGLTHTYPPNLNKFRPFLRKLWAFLPIQRFSLQNTGKNSNFDQFFGHKIQTVCPIGLKSLRAPCRP